MTISHWKMITYNNIISSQVNQILFFGVFNYLDWSICPAGEKRGWCPGNNENDLPASVRLAVEGTAWAGKWILWHWRHVNWSRDQEETQGSPIIIGFYVVLHPWDYSLSSRTFCYFTTRLFCWVYFAGVQVSVMYKLYSSPGAANFRIFLESTFLDQKYHRQTGQQIRSHSKFRKKKVIYLPQLFWASLPLCAWPSIWAAARGTPARVFLGGYWAWAWAFFSLRPEQRGCGGVECEGEGVWGRGRSW